MMIVRKIVSVSKIFVELIYSFIVYKHYCRKYQYVDYFDYKKLSNPKFIEPRGFNSVCHYGNYKAVANITGKRFNFITDYVEHGASFRTEPEEMKNIGYYNRSTIRRIYAMSEFNVSVYNECIKSEKLKSTAIAIGPYIKGADFFHSKSKIDEIKNKYGRILLVFPHHSTEVMKSEYDIDGFINTISHYKKEHHFDSIFICLYWADILRSRDEKYLQKGFIVVSAGHRSDPQFMSRLKDLIYLSDHTMSNYIGGYIGYSVCMGKPHFLYNQPTKYFVAGKEMKKLPSLEEAKMKFHEVFDTFATKITSEQYELVEKYWGKWSK